MGAILTISNSNDKALMSRITAISEAKTVSDITRMVDILEHYVELKSSNCDISKAVEQVKAYAELIVSESQSFVKEGFPDEGSEFGIYTNGCDEFANIQYGVFSSTEVAKDGLKKLNVSQPVLFGVISRIVRKGILELSEVFFPKFVEWLILEGVSQTNLDLAGLDLSRLGRAYGSFSALLSLFELASENDIGITLMGLDNPTAVFGIMTGAVSQTQMRFNQTISRLRSSLWKLGEGIKDKKGNSFLKYVTSSISDLFNNKTAYQPHLSRDEYIKLITSKLPNDAWLEYL